MPAETTRIFVALRPDEPLDALVRGHKRRLLAAAGPQLYATDPPHATLYLAEFSRQRVADVLRGAGDLAATIRAAAVTIDGWHAFENDPLTGLHTLVCRFDAASCGALRMVQLRALDALAPLHDAEATARTLAPRMPSLSPDQQRCARQFGFPYVGGGWIPHLTIASVRPSEWPHVGQVFNLSHDDAGDARLQASAPNADLRAPPHLANATTIAVGRHPPAADWSHPTTGQFTTLEVFELHGLEPHSLAAFPLAPRPQGKAA